MARKGGAMRRLGTAVIAIVLFLAGVPAASAAPVATTTALSTSTPTAPLGQPIWVYVDVTASGSVPTGTVHILDGATVVTAVQLFAGSAAVALYPTTGDHSYVAHYAGGGSFAASASSPLTTTVTKADTVLAMSVQAPAWPYEPFTMSVRAAAGPNAQPPVGATGDVSVALDGKHLRTVPADDGNPFAMPAVKAAGTHTITVQYPGDGNYLTRSATYTFTTGRHGTEMSLVASNGASSASCPPGPPAPPPDCLPTSTSTEPITFSAEARSTDASLPNGTPAPGGTVTFYVDGRARATVPVTRRLATASVARWTTTLPAGGHGVWAKYNGDGVWSGSTSGNVTARIVATPAGYWMLGADGSVYPFGTVVASGNAPTGAMVRKIEPLPNGTGYWIVDAAGSVSHFGAARPHGSVTAGSLIPGEEVASMSSTPTGNGYWVFTTRGRVFTFGDARGFGSMAGTPLNAPIVGSIATASGRGYYMVAGDGGIFSFGDARFFGSMGGRPLNRPINGLVPTTSGRGYWLVASDGGIFAFGDAPFRGSMGGTPLNRPIVGMVRYGTGYLMVGADGGIFSFSNRPFLGSLGSAPPPSPIVAVAATT